MVEVSEKVVRDEFEGVFRKKFEGGVIFVVVMGLKM